MTPRGDCYYPSRAGLGRIEVFLEDRLLLKLNSKTSIRKMTSGIEFVGKIVTPSGIRVRKSTRNRIKRVFRHMADLYRCGAVDIDDIIPTIASYFGLLQHAQSFNLRSWISQNIVFCRSESPPEIPSFSERDPEADWWEHVEEPGERWRDAA